MTWTSRRRKSFNGIKGLTDGPSITPRLPSIGRLHKGTSEEITTRSGKKARRPIDLDYFRFTSAREGEEGDLMLAAFSQAYGQQPRLLDVYLPYPEPEENFQTCCEEWKAGGLVHRCDGETMSLWRDADGVYHVDQPRPCPYFGHPELRTKNPPNPGCREVGRLNVILPALVEMGYVGSVVLVTTSINDIVAISTALWAVVEEQERNMARADLRGILFGLRRVPELISTPGPDGGRIRRQKWMVVIEPAREWVQLQLRMAREAALPELPPAWRPQAPDWEDATSNGRPVAEIGEIIEGEAEEEVEDPAGLEPPGFAEGEEGDAPPPDDGGSPSHSGLEAARAWLEAVRSRIADAGAASPGEPVKGERQRIAMLLKDVWPNVSKQTILDERRHCFTAMAMPRTGRISTANAGEVRTLLVALGDRQLDQGAAAHIRTLVEAPGPGQAELFPEAEEVDL